MGRYAIEPDYVTTAGEPRWNCGAPLVDRYAISHWATNDPTCSRLVLLPGIRCAKHGGPTHEDRNHRRRASVARYQAKQAAAKRRANQRERVRRGLPPDLVPSQPPIFDSWQDAALVGWWLDHGGLDALTPPSRLPDRNTR